MPSMTANDSSEAVDTVVKFDFLKDKKFNVYVTGAVYVKCPVVCESWGAVGPWVHML